MVMRATVLTAIVTAGLTLGSLPAAAQTPASPPPAGQTPSPAPRTDVPDAPKSGGIAKTIGNLFDRSLHPTVGSVGPSGGITGGVEWTPERWKDGQLEMSSRALISLRNYWTLEGMVGWEKSRRYRIEAFSRARNMPQLRYHGLGTETTREQVVNYRQLDRSLGLLGAVRPVGWLSVGTRIERLWPSLSAGTRANIPSIETRFDDITAPGLAAQPPMTHVQLFAAVTVPALDGQPRRFGGDYKATYGTFRDGGRGQSFRRIEAEVRERFAVPGPEARLTLHAFYSDSQAAGANRVPFHLMRTLGGSNTLLAYREVLLGGDDTRASLRGFSTFRFRDQTLLLGQAEYRFTVRGPIVASVFADAGKVARRPSDLDLGPLRRNLGFSISAVRRFSTLVRIDVGFGGGEGPHGFLSFGKGF